MRLLHLDCFSGLAGDMFLGAACDLGMPIELVADAVARLEIDGLAVEARPDRRGRLAGVRFRVLFGGRPIEGPDPAEPQRCGVEAVPLGPWQGRRVATSELRRRVAAATLGAGVERRALTLLDRLATAQAAAAAGEEHPPGWSEPAALDLLVDLVGAAVAAGWLAADRVSCGPVEVGGPGTVGGGRLPIPGGVTARLLPGVPVVGGSGGELLTPTGATILAVLVDEFRPLPLMRVRTTGIGLGRAELGDRPNAVRLWLGEAAPELSEEAALGASR